MTSSPSSFSSSSSPPSMLERSMLWPEPHRKSRTRSSWTEADEVRLLNAVLEIVKADSPGECVSLFDPIMSVLRGDYTKEQVIDKLNGLKRRFKNFSSSLGDDATASSHQTKLSEICKKIWGENSDAPNGGLRRANYNYNCIGNDMIFFFLFIRSLFLDRNVI